MFSEATRPVCTFIASPVHCVCVCVRANVCVRMCDCVGVCTCICSVFSVAKVEVF